MSKYHGHRTSKPVSKTHGCACPDGEQPCGVELEAWNEGDDSVQLFLGGGDTPEAAYADAEQHAYVTLGGDADDGVVVIGWDWPA